MSDESKPTELLIALLNAVEGQESAFNRWYTDEHLPEVVRLPGIVSAQRYALPESLVGQLPHRYATIYEVDGSAAAAMQQLYVAEFSSQSDTLDLSTMLMSPFAPFGDPIAPA